MTEIIIYNVQRVITPKVCKPELWFLCSACRLVVDNISVKFHDFYLKQVYRLQSRHKYLTEITIYNIQRAVTAKVGKQELWVLCFTCRLMLVNISVKFDENISLNSHVTKRT